MSALDDFYASYLHYTVAQRLFEDTCRQLITFKGGLDERQAMVDETLRLSMCVTDNIDETEGLMADAIEFIQSETGDAGLLEALSLIANNLKEDRARANSYSNYVTYRRIGNRTRKPRKPQVANPFVPIVDDYEPVESVVIPPMEVRPDPEPLTEEVPENEGPSDSAEPSEGPEPDEVESPDTPSEDNDGDGSANPLAEEAERILRGEAAEPEEVCDPEDGKKG
jgi:hypothetical protein